jgi:hypothetical protein
MKKKSEDSVLKDQMKICELLQECFILNSVELGAGLTSIQTFYASCLEDMGMPYEQYCITLEQMKSEYKQIWEPLCDDLIVSS